MRPSPRGPDTSRWPAEHVPARPGGRRLRVYLLDDHEVARRGLRELLSAYGDLDLVGDSGRARPARAMVLRLRPDVLVCDLRLRDDSGILVCRDVRAGDTAIAVVLHTTAGPGEALAATLLAGAAGYVVKLDEDASVVDAVRRAGTGQALLEPRAVARAGRRLRDELQRLRPPLGTATMAVMSELLDGCTNAQIAQHQGRAVEAVGADIAATIRRLPVGAA